MLEDIRAGIHLYLAIITRNLSSHIDVHTHNITAPDNRVTLTFDLTVNTGRATVIHRMSTNVDDDSSSCFPFTVWTHTVTEITDHHIHTLATTSTCNYRSNCNCPTINLR